MTDKHEKEVVTIALRLTGAPAIRFQRVIAFAKRRNPYANKSDVIKELLGLVKPNALTPEEIEYFRTGKKLK